MLKDEYKILCDIDPDGLDETMDFSSDEKKMLKCFLTHLSYCASRPSQADKQGLADAYFKGKN